MTQDEIIDTDYDFLCSETTLKKDISKDELIEFFKQRKTNGCFRVELVNGGQRVVMLSEKTRIPENKRDAIRKILGMS